MTVNRPRPSKHTERPGEWRTLGYDDGFHGRNRRPPHSGFTTREQSAYHEGFDTGRANAEIARLREALETIRAGLADDRAYRDTARAALKGE